MYIKDEKNNYSKENPICVIDFYVVKGYERKGYGKVSHLKILKYLI